MQTNTFHFNVPELQAGHAALVFYRVLIIAVLAFLSHFLVRAVQAISNRIIRKNAAKKTLMGFVTQQPKFITLSSLIASGLTFTIYFLAVGLILREFNVNLAAYLATASVIGLAVGFGSQGLVQDVVTGLTLILSDTLDVGDVIEIAGKIGRVERVGLRFTQLNNFLNQQVYVPNRVIADISRFPRGEMSAYADVQIPASLDAKRASEMVNRIACGLWNQFNAIILRQPELSEIQSVEPGGWKYIRVHFKLWPGQGPLIETTFRQHLISAMKSVQPDYDDWRVVVTYRAPLMVR